MELILTLAADSNQAAGLRAGTHDRGSDHKAALRVALAVIEAVDIIITANSKFIK
jgi:hypothetical protein